MEKEFVPFELAVKLKELGFDEPCLAHYIKNNQYRINKGKILLHVGRLDYDDIYKEYVLENVPLYQQVFDWLREKHNLYVNIFNDPINSMNFRFYYSITESGYLNYYESCDDEIYFETVIEARQAALNKLIEIVENEQNNLKFY